MITLCINSALPETSIALIDDACVLAEQSWNLPRTESQLLLPHIESLLTSVQYTVGDIDRVLVVRGPGIFTSLRIGITIANTISFAQHVPIGAIDTMQLLAACTTVPYDAVVFETAPDTIFCMQSLETHRFTASQLFAQPVKKLTGILSEYTVSQLPASWTFERYVTESSLGKAAIKLLPSVTWGQTSISPVYLREPGITEPKKR